MSFNNEKLSRILHDANSNDFLYTGTVTFSSLLFAFYVCKPLLFYCNCYQVNTTHWMIPALHAAAYKGYDDIIYTLLSSEDLDVDQQDDVCTFFILSLLPFTLVVNTVIL